MDISLVWVINIGDVGVSPNRAARSSTETKGTLSLPMGPTGGGRVLAVASAPSNRSVLAAAGTTVPCADQGPHPQTPAISTEHPVSSLGGTGLAQRGSLARGGVPANGGMLSVFEAMGLVDGGEPSTGSGSGVSGGTSVEEVGGVPETPAGGETGPPKRAQRGKAKRRGGKGGRGGAAAATKATTRAAAAAAAEATPAAKQVLVAPVYVWAGLTSVLA